MADELKSMLTKVLHNKGVRRYFFAYGTGKRPDGNGDGHLIVAGKKPKKADVQAECPCQTYVDGFCWSSLDGQNLFFQSKAAKLSTTTITKMALTAKKLTGRSYDFQIPTPEEEARSDSLTEGAEAEQEGQAPSPVPEGETAAPAAPGAEAEWVQRRARIEPIYLQALKDQRGDVARMQALFAFAVQKAGTSEFSRALLALANLEKLLNAAAAASPATPADTAARSAFQARLKGLLVKVLKADQGPTLAEMRRAIAEAQSLAGKQDFAKANVALDRVEELLARSAAPVETPAEAAARAQLKEAIAALRGDLKAVLKAAPANAADLAKRYKQAAALAKTGDVEKGQQMVRELGALLQAAPKAPAAPAAPQAETAEPPAVAAFRKDWTVAKSELQAALDTVTDQLAEFASALMETGESNLVWVAEEGLSQVLGSLREAAVGIERATSKAPAQAAAKARPGIENLRKQLKTPRVRACDENNLGVTVTINSTIGKAIKRLEAALALAG